MIIVLPFSNIKVNLYSYTVLNKLRETRLLIEQKDKVRPTKNYKTEESNDHAKDLVKKMENNNTNRSQCMQSSGSKAISSLTSKTNTVELKSIMNSFGQTLNTKKQIDVLKMQTFAKECLEYGYLWSVKIKGKKQGELALPTTEELQLGLYKWLCE